MTRRPEGHAGRARQRRKVALALKVAVVDPSALAPQKDPDEFVRAHGVEYSGGRLVETAVSWAMYVGRTFLEGIGPESPVLVRREAVERVLDYVATLPAPARLDRADVIARW